MEWRGKSLIDAGRDILSAHVTWKILHTSRLCNRSAHNLAEWAQSLDIVGYISPPNIPPAVICDRGGTPAPTCSWLPPFNLMV